MYIQMNYVLPGLNNRVFWYFYQDLNGKMMLYEAVKKEKVAAVLTLLDAGAGKHHILHFRISLLRCGYFWVMRTCVSAQTERGNSLGGATKKRKISRTSLPIDLHFSEVHLGKPPALHVLGFNFKALILTFGWPTERLNYWIACLGFGSREGPGGSHTN